MKQIEGILRDYVATPRTDYAILLSGPWGSGKTYYVKNRLFQAIRRMKWKWFARYSPVYISLHGLTKVQEVSEKLLLSKLGIDESGARNLSLLKSGIDIVKSLPFPVGLAASLALGLGSLARQGLSDGLNLSRNVVFIDDIERIDKSLELSTVLGYIHSNYIEHAGTKVVFIADGKALETDEGYKRAKEKVVGRVASFSQEMKELLPGFVDSRYSAEPSFRTALSNQSERIVDIFRKGEEVNLRTLAFALDNLRTLFHSSSGYHQVFPELVAFSTPISLEFKKGHLSELDQENLKGLDDLYGRYSSWKAFHKEEERKEYNIEFFERYFLESPDDFVFINSAYVYILTGYLDEKELQRELSLITKSKKEDEKETAYHRVFHFHETEEESLSEALISALAFAAEGDYAPRQYFDLCTAIEIFIQRDYLPGVVPTDYYDTLKAGLNVSLDRVSKEHPEVAGDTDYWRQIAATNPLERPKELARIAIAHIEERIKTITRKLALEFLESLNLPDRSFIGAWEKMDKRSVFETIVSEGLSGRLLSLNSVGIYDLQALLHADFLRISNAGTLYSGNIEPLRALARDIEANLPATDLGHLRKKRLNELVADFRKTADHIEKTRGQASGASV